jgi:hypothetical protein
MAIITFAECLLLSCSGCGEQRLIDRDFPRGRGEVAPVDHPDTQWRLRHGRCPPRELRRPEAETL